MKGDFSRDTFDKKNDFLRVLMQQGRVHVDADWNEQIAIMWDYLRNLAVDLGGKQGGNAFELVVLGKKDGEPEEPLGSSPKIKDIHRIVVRAEGDEKNNGKLVQDPFYYVEGYRCRGVETELWTKAKKDLPTENQGIYLKVWERHITYREHDLIREKALGGADTSSRSKLICQLHTQPFDTPEDFQTQLKQWQVDNTARNRGRMSAKLGNSNNEGLGACLQPPGAEFQGSEKSRI